MVTFKIQNNCCLIDYFLKVSHLCRLSTSFGCAIDVTKSKGCIPILTMLIYESYSAINEQMIKPMYIIVQWICKTNFFCKHVQEHLNGKGSFRLRFCFFFNLLYLKNFKKEPSHYIKHFQNVMKFFNGGHLASRK